MLHEKQDAQHDALKAENEVKKLLLEIDHNATFHQEGDDLPPEVESAWLDNIRQFEEMHKNAGRCTIFELIGRPELRKAGDIPDNEIEAEFDKLQKILEDHYISFSALAEYKNPERLFYTFITEELLNHETDDVIMPGMFSCYTYEEFVPNHEYDIRNRTEELISYIFEDMRTEKQRFDEYYFDVNDFIEVDTDDAKYKKKYSPSLTNFFRAFPVRKIINSEISKIEFRLTGRKDEDIQGDATANVLINYTAQDEYGKEVNFAGTGTLHLQLHWEWWRIVKIELPGLRMG